MNISDRELPKLFEFKFKFISKKLTRKIDSNRLVMGLKDEKTDRKGVNIFRKLD
jgi:hypothetical protein